MFGLEDHYFQSPDSPYFFIYTLVYLICRFYIAASKIGRTLFNQALHTKIIQAKKKAVHCDNIFV